MLKSIEMTIIKRQAISFIRPSSQTELKQRKCMPRVFNSIDFLWRQNKINLSQKFVLNLVIHFHFKELLEKTEWNKTGSSRKMYWSWSIELKNKIRPQAVWQERRLRISFSISFKTRTKLWKHNWLSFRPIFHDLNRVSSSKLKIEREGEHD